MTQTSPQNPPPYGTATLETQMQLCLDETRKALARAEAVDPQADAYGHGSANEYAHAMRFLKMSAKLGLALSKLNGVHTINVNKREITAYPTLANTQHDKPRPGVTYVYETDPEEGDPSLFSPGSNAAK